MTNIYHQLENVVKNLELINNNLPHPGWTIALAVGAILTAIVALLSALGIIQRLYTPKQKIIIGDRLIFIISVDKSIHKIHIPISIINRRFYPITVNKIVCQLNLKNSYDLNWNLFVKSILDPEQGLVAVPADRPAPFSVMPGSSKEKNIEFFSSENIEFIKGEFKGEIQMWSEVDKISKKPTEKLSFRFSIDDEKIKQHFNEINAIQKVRVIRSISVPIKEWTIGWEKNI